MERGKIISAICLFVQLPIVSQASVIFECGRGTGEAFNGWEIHPYQAFTAVDFHEESVSFYSAAGGEYTLSLTRKIDAMRNIPELSLDVDFNVVQNCELKRVEVYLSADGESWEYFEISPAELRSKIINDGEFNYLKLKAEVLFLKDGLLECCYVKMETAETMTLESAIPLNPEVQKEFFVFVFDRTIYVETSLEENYEIYITNMAGQIMSQEIFNGSNHFAPDLVGGTYVLVVMQNGEVKETKKFSLN